SVSVCLIPCSSVISFHVSSQFAHVSGMPTLFTSPSSFAFSSIFSKDKAFGSSIDEPLVVSSERQATNANILAPNSTVASLFFLKVSIPHTTLCCLYWFFIVFIGFIIKLVY